MLEKFAAWFICFGVSFLAQSCWGTEQGKAFLYIHIGVSVFFVFLPIVLMLISGKGRNLSVPSSIMVLVTAAVIAVSLIVTWGASKLFNVDFYVAYQIMTFGQCMCSNQKEKNT